MKTCPNCRAVYPNHFAVCPRDAAQLIEADEWSEGMVIRGKYRILSKVGQGGMGAVYKALHVKFDQVRALKVMTGDLAVDSDFVKRFEREAVLMSRLQHPNVVRVDDIDESEDGRPFIVMEFVEGRSLRQVIEAEGPLGPLRACSIARQAAAGLGAAHLMGMVHRDVKPENIVLINTAAGETAKVLDFGIAKLKEAKLGDGLRTATGIVIGTAQYLSPEQALGMRSEELDGRSDLYSLGLVIYQMLTCALPFHADSAVGWMMARLNEPPRPIQSVRPNLEIPDALATLVMRCLAKDRDQRPADAEALVAEIECVEEGIRTPVCPPAPGFTDISKLPISQPDPRIMSDPAFGPKPGAFSTSPWAGGRRFWYGLGVVMLAPLIAWPLVDATPYSPGEFMPGFALALFSIVGGLGWWMLTRRHWAFRLGSLLPLAFVALLLSARVANIYTYSHHAWSAPAGPPVQLYTMEELKRSNRSPLEMVQSTPALDEKTRMPIIQLVLQNITSDARLTDWKVREINFDGQGKILSDTEPVNRAPAPIEPGKTLSMQITGGDLDKVKSVKMIFKEVDYEVTTPGGAMAAEVWVNSHFAEDVQKAKLP